MADPVPPTRLRKWLEWLGCFAFVLIPCCGGWSLVGYWIFSGICANEVRRTVLSPDGKLKAVAFRRDCGATTAYSYQLSVIPAGQDLPNWGWNVYSGEAAENGKFHWKGPRTLVVESNDPGRLFVRSVDVQTGWFQHETVRVEYHR
jgi:hypothetical protein